MENQMIRVFRDSSIKNKLLFIQLYSSVSGLIFAILLLLVFEVSEFKQNAQDDLSTMAALIGDRSIAAMLFDDPILAKENLSALEAAPIFHSACLYDKKGYVFSSLKRAEHMGEACPKEYNGQVTHYNEIELHVYQPIRSDNERLGMIYVHADLTVTFVRKLEYLTMLFMVLMATTLTAFLLTMPLLKLISEPLKKLTATIHAITEENDYSRRAVKKNNDELGELVDGFNAMVTTVEFQNRALHVSKNHYQALYDDNPTMVFNLTVYGSILSANRFGAKQLDLNSDTLKNSSIFDFIHPEDQVSVQMLFDSCIANPDEVHKRELRMICRNGRVIWARETARRVINENQQGNILLVCEDVTENRVLSEKIAYQASHDALTGLVNRLEFDAIIQQAFKQARSEKVEHTLCYLDLDQFKVVNDTSGHLAGDELLRQLGGMLKSHIRKGDVLARLGGDEFGILMRNCSLDSAYHACEKLRNTIRDFRFAWEDRSFSIGVSIGLALINRMSGNVVETLKQADAACYAAKERGRNRVHAFKPDDQELALRQGEMQWVERIRQGIEKNQFILYGQLIVPISDELDDGLHFETLVRYQRELGSEIIPPGAFLSSAERYNMASSLDKWVIERLFQWLAEDADFLQRLSKCSVNLSGLSMSDESMLDFITDMFDQHQIPTNKICFEITETAAIGNLTYATTFINHLREKGCSFSLDDFGSGLSSFAYLKNLPVDYLKIDGLFVKDILDDKIDLAMVKSINEVAHVMGKKTIAEFVENKDIFNLLGDLGVDYAQGYGIAKPVPLDALRQRRMK